MADIDFMNRLNANPQWQQGLAMMRGDSPEVAMRMASAAQQMNAQQAERQRAEQAQRALGQAISGGLGNVSQEQLAQLAQISPEYALKIMEMQRLQQKEAQRMEMMQAMFGGGQAQSGNMASKMAAYGAMTGDPTMIAGAQFIQEQQKDAPEAISERELAKAKAKMDAENISTLESSAAKLPSLIENVNRLSELGKTATYTQPGQAIDWLARQAGVATPGAVARTEFESMVDNQVLPLLRDTFGAAFTVEEGNRLRATLGNPDFSPEEKDAALKAFIKQKVNDIRSTGRQYGFDTSFADDALKNLSIGKRPSGDLSTLRQQAQQAIDAGRSPEAVRRMFKEKTGEDL